MKKSKTLKRPDPLKRVGKHLNTLEMEKSSSSLSSKNLEASLLQLISNHSQSSLRQKQHTGTQMI